PPPPAQQTPALTVQIVSVTSLVRRNSNATLVVQTAPGAQCAITVTYRSGPSTAAGLDPKTADGAGRVGWTWPVGGNTTPGSWPTEVRCSAGGQTATGRTAFTVQQPRS